MRMDRDSFRAWEHKAVTLLGMSGVGKTTLANRLPKSNWFHYSGDYRIGTRYLREPILDNLKKQAMTVPLLRELLRSDSIYLRTNITTDNLACLSTFLGKVGDPALGGLSVDEFRRRQDLHRAAEIEAMRDVAQFIDKAREIYGYTCFVNDAGGSVCEIDDIEVLEVLAAHTVILYLRTDEALEAEVIRRQRSDPKPLYYRAEFFDANLAEYLRQHDIPDPSRIEPDPFVQWMFPRLIEHRRPRYEAIAARYGYTVSARDAESVRDEHDFVEMVCAALAPEAARCR